MDHHPLQPNANLPRDDARTVRMGTGSAAGHDGTGAMAIRLLNRALALAQAVRRRCERQYVAAVRDCAPAVAVAALEHANDAGIDIERIGERIGELGGLPGVAEPPPDDPVPCSRAEARLASSLPALISSHLTAERDALEGYREIASFFRPFDPATRRLIEHIAADAEQRSRELAGLLAEMSNS